MLQVGDKAPEFDLPVSGGKETLHLKDLLGKKVILYFYPKDDTPGCTKEACSFNDHLGSIKSSGAVVLGVSADSVESHGRFAEKYGLRFPLLSDPDKKTIKAYGVWKEKTLYGRTFMGIERSTFVIDEKGKIAAIFRKVKVDGHTEQILENIEPQ
jgi:peroxiredoxin Q/BCP